MSINFEHILFPVDFSDESRRAAPFVRATAEHFRSEVLMLYVSQLPPMMLAAPPDVPPPAIIDLDDLRNERRTELETFAHEELRGVPVTWVIVEGDPGQEIVKHARSEPIDLVMMATHGHGTFHVAVLGSVTTTVLKKVDRPVWTATHTSASGAHARPRWHRIICAVDVTQGDVRIAKWAAELAKGEGADLCLVHAIEGTETQQDDLLLNLITDKARDRFESVLVDVGLEHRIAIQFGDPQHVVKRVATDWEADLVVIGRDVIREPLGLLRTKSYAILRESPCPVISV